jgi:hypothetical protein
MPDPLKVICRRCERLEFVYTVPLRLPAAEDGWQALCTTCFREVLQVEPTENLALRPIKHQRRSRRKWS